MHYKLIYENHWNFGIHVADTLLMIKYALEDAGHRADIEKNICVGFTNIVLENFDDEFVQRALNSFSEDQNTKFIIVATEFLVNGGFNQFVQDAEVLNKSHYDDIDYWQKRYINFSKLLPVTTAIWHLSEQQVDVYRQALQRADVFYLPHIYSDKLYTVKHRPDEEKDIDFVFTGTLTDYRKKVLYQLESRGYKVATLPMLTASFHREDVISRSKVALNIKQYAQWQHPSNSRFFYHIVNRSILVSEHCQYKCDLNAYIEEASEGNFVEHSIQALKQGNWCDQSTKRANAFTLSHAGEKRITPILHNESV